MMEGAGCRAMGLVMAFHYDLLVIGAGSGGMAAAQRAAAYGARVAIAERNTVGGACINYGCIPEKLLDYAAGGKDLNQAIASYGWKVNDLSPKASFDWSHFIAAKNQHIHHLNQLHSQHLEQSRVQLLLGQASFLDAHTVNVDGGMITADKILIAVGAKPLKPPIPGIEHTIDWHELYNLPTQPQSLAILGSNPIGVKVAGSMDGLGSQVTQILPESCLLPAFDAEISQIIQERMMQQGVQVRCNTAIETIEPKGDRLSLRLSGTDPAPLTVDAVVVDAPRRPALDGLNLGKVGIQLTSAGAIRVDAYSRTTHSHIFAIGDCTDRLPLTPSAIAQGKAFADTEWGGKPHSVSYDWAPMAISSHPEAAVVGFSEDQARQKWGEAVRCYHNQFRPLFYALSQIHHNTLLKVVVNQQDDERILGIHMIGDGAVEIVQSLAIALRLGATKHDLNAALGIHPSSGEELFSF